MGLHTRAGCPEPRELQSADDLFTVRGPWKNVVTPAPQDLAAQILVRDRRCQYDAGFRLRFRKTLDRFAPIGIRGFPVLNNEWNALTLQDRQGLFNRKSAEDRPFTGCCNVTQKGMKAIIGGDQNNPHQGICPQAYGMPVFSATFPRLSPRFVSKTKPPAQIQHADSSSSGTGKGCRLAPTAR